MAPRIGWVNSRLVVCQELTGADDDPPSIPTRTRLAGLRRPVRPLVLEPGAAPRSAVFLLESTWDHEAVNQQRIVLLCTDAATAPHERGALVIGDTGDRRDGIATALLAREYLGSLGRIDNAS